MASNPSNSAPQSSQLATGSAAALAQLVDQIAQDHGLTGQTYQQFHMFAVRVRPTVAELWSYAATLHNGAASTLLSTELLAVGERLDAMETLISKEFRLTESHETAFKNLLRHFITTTRTSYDNLDERVKRYVGQYPMQFFVPAYATNDVVAVVINKYIDGQSHQIKSSFRKLLFNEALSNRTLDEFTQVVLKSYSNQPQSVVPIYIKAHLAQL
ncbi:hypothetical protein V565_306410, partial [Rhizoctonia solani 123E]